MKNMNAAVVITAVLLTASVLPQSTMAQTPSTAAKKAAPSTKKMDAAPAAAPTAQEIADAKSKGMVWVNLGTGIYHKEGEFFGKTKKGKFMTEADATKAGYRAAKASGIGKKDSAKAKTETKK